MPHYAKKLAEIFIYFFKKKAIFYLDAYTKKRRTFNPKKTKISALKNYRTKEGDIKDNDDVFLNPVGFYQSFF